MHHGRILSSMNRPIDQLFVRCRIRGLVKAKTLYEQVASMEQVASQVKANKEQIYQQIHQLKQRIDQLIHEITVEINHFLQQERVYS